MRRWRLFFLATAGLFGDSGGETWAREPLPIGGRLNRDTLLRFALAYLAAGLTMAVLDSAWLTLTNAALYRAELGPMLANGFRPVQPSPST